MYLLCFAWYTWRWYTAIILDYDEAALSLLPVSLAALIKLQRDSAGRKDHVQGPLSLGQDAQEGFQVRWMMLGEL